MTSRSKGPIIAAVVAVLLVGVGVWYFYLRDDAPPEVDLDTATEQVSSTTTPDGSTTTTDTTDPAGIAGMWTVDNESGEFDFESATGSFAGFRVTEELASIGTKDAVGRTGEVTGTMEIAGTTLQSAEIEVDMTAIETDESRRDNKVQAALETDSFPAATFVLTQPIDLGAEAASGDQVSVEAVGDLTIHGVTQQVTVELEAQLVEETAVVVGSVPITFGDFGVEAPSAPVVLSVSDEATIEFQLLFVR